MKGNYRQLVVIAADSQSAKQGQYLKPPRRTIFELTSGEYPNNERTIDLDSKNNKALE